MAEIEKSKAKVACVFGAIALVCGVVLFIVGCVWAGYGGPDASGIWCGILLIIQGILGIVGYVKLNKLAMVFYLVLAILNTILCIVQAVIAVIAWIIWAFIGSIVKSQCTMNSNNECDCGKDDVPLKLDTCDTVTLIETLYIIILIISAIAAIICFASSIVGCVMVCCGKAPTQTNVVVVQQQPAFAVAQGGQQNPAYPPQAYPPGQAYPMQ